MSQLGCSMLSGRFPLGSGTCSKDSRVFWSRLFYFVFCDMLYLFWVAFLYWIYFFKYQWNLQLSDEILSIYIYIYIVIYAFIQIRLALKMHWRKGCLCKITIFFFQSSIFIDPTNNWRQTLPNESFGLLCSCYWKR